MPSKYRDVVERAQVIAGAWDSVAPDATLAGLTLAQFRNRVKPAQDVREECDSLRAQLRAKREEMSGANTVANLTIKQVVNAVRADPAHGSDSPLLAALHYTTDSQRKSGLTRKSNGNGTEAESVAPVDSVASVA